MSLSQNLDFLSCSLFYLKLDKNLTSQKSNFENKKMVVAKMENWEYLIAIIGTIQSHSEL